MSSISEESTLSDRKRSFFSLALGLFFIIMLGELSGASYVLVATALPKIAARYQTTQIAWAFTILSITSALIIGLVGKLADMKGKRMVLLCLVTSATIGSIISANAPNYATFLVGRALQGTLYLVPAIGFSLIRDVFPRNLVALGISMVFTGAGVVYVAGPFVAGWLINNFGLLSVFWFLSIYQVICMVGIVITVPESTIRVQGKLNWVASALVGIGSAILIYTIGESSEWGWTSTKFVGGVMTGLLCYALWIKRDSKHPHPLIEIKQLRTRRMWTTLVVTFVVFSATNATNSILPGMLQTPPGIGAGFGFGLNEYGVARFMVPMAITLTAGGILVGAMSRFWGIRVPLIIGLLAVATSTMALRTLPDAPVTIMSIMAVYGLGVGITTGCLPNLMMQSVPQEIQGIAATTQATVMVLGAGIPTQLIFMILGQHTIELATGYYFGAVGYRLSFEVIAAIAAIAVPFVMFVVPHGRRVDVARATAGV
ncbi:MFS transporter [Burkholderia sp. Ax-1719]|uniref:MFS transporter n=1 Tax=Burkholderia sp. Ax-1719 TaxID=2608334 RepID=UPI00141EE107|nr:MFS transporter [Burkholderia sp. Ax-1719]